MARLGAALIARERRAGRGEPVTKQERVAIESALEDCAEETQRFVSANFAALLDEMEPDCVRAA